jgi:hypothetical protein
MLVNKKSRDDIENDLDINLVYVTKSGDNPPGPNLWTYELQGSKHTPPSDAAYLNVLTNQLITRSLALLEWPPVVKRLKDFPAFMETEGSLPTVSVV